MCSLETLLGGLWRGKAIIPPMGMSSNDKSASKQAAKSSSIVSPIDCCESLLARVVKEVERSQLLPVLHAESIFSNVRVP